jgi:hypothetical protein
MRCYQLTTIPLFSTQNWKCHPIWKLCPSTNWATFILVDFEVFRWILENATKVPEDIQGHQGLSGVWPCLWPRFDYKCVLTWSIGSLRLVGEVFEERTQVDRDLTTVSRVDRLLWLNKNLGRHSEPLHALRPPSPPSPTSPCTSHLWRHISP